MGLVRIGNQSRRVSTSAVLAAVVVCSRRALLLRIQAKRFELLTPFRWKFAQPLDVNALRQSALDSSADQLGSKKGERDGHVDMSSPSGVAESKPCTKGNCVQVGESSNGLSAIKIDQARAMEWRSTIRFEKAVASANGGTA